ncbi:MAG: DUF839 domain-containing protein [Saprospiraceae bacterium]|nr:DUF839 domain-containing protein [Saprospiraceae bacterium]
MTITENDLKMKKPSNRRDFISFLGKATLGAVLVPPFLESCGNHNNQISHRPLTEEEINDLKKLVIEGLPPTDIDDVVLARGLDSDVLIRWGTPINESETFGFNNDFTCFIPIEEGVEDDGLLWVNHEYVDTLFITGYNRSTDPRPRKKEDVDREMKEVGGSIIRVKKIDGKWTFIPDDPLNRRIDGKTEIPFAWPEPIMGKRSAIGTLSNCSGGITPWGTILTCEENYEDFYGHAPGDFSAGYEVGRTWTGWDEVYPYPSEHYGWVVEVDPFTGEAKKHVSLGRCSHECATLKRLEDGRIVAYTGDDQKNEHIYKFISSKPDSLEEGTLYVADTENGIWLSLDYESQPILQKHFSSQTEVLIRLRYAAKLLGATPQNRPEDIEIDPLTGHIFIALTNNKPKKDYHGEILKIKERDGCYDALEFEAETLIAGGKETDFSCPDNLAFDMSGNLWFTCDMSSGDMNNLLKPQYWPFKNNSLHVLIRHGEDAGKIIRVVSAPIQAELTGPWFSPDNKTLFLSVQHPGEKTNDLDHPTSTWPHDGDNIPKPSVITIEGPLLDKLNRLQELVEG